MCYLIETLAVVEVLLYVSIFHVWYCTTKFGLKLLGYSLYTVILVGFLLNFICNLCSVFNSSNSVENKLFHVTIVSKNMHYNVKSTFKLNDGRYVCVFPLSLIASILWNWFFLLNWLYDIPLHHLFSSVVHPPHPHPTPTTRYIYMYNLTFLYFLKTGQYSRSGFGTFNSNLLEHWMAVIYHFIETIKLSVWAEVLYAYLI